MFEIGDKVIYHGADKAAYKREGTIVSIEDKDGKPQLVVELDGGGGFTAPIDDWSRKFNNAKACNAARSRNAVVQKALNAWVPRRGAARGYEWKETTAERRIKSELKASGAKSADYLPWNHGTARTGNYDTLSWHVVAHEDDIEKVAAKMRQLGMSDVSKPKWDAYDNFYVVGYTKIDAMPMNAETSVLRETALNAATRNANFRGSVWDRALAVSVRPKFSKGNRVKVVGHPMEDGVRGIVEKTFPDGQVLITTGYDKDGHPYTVQVHQSYLVRNSVVQKALNAETAVNGSSSPWGFFVGEQVVIKKDPSKKKYRIKEIIGGDIILEGVGPRFDASEIDTANYAGPYRTTNAVVAKARNDKWIDDKKKIDRVCR